MTNALLVRSARIGIKPWGNRHYHQNNGTLKQPGTADPLVLNVISQPVLL